MHLVNKLLRCNRGAFYHCVESHRKGYCVNATPSSSPSTGQKKTGVWPHVSRAQAVQRGTHRPWGAGNSTGRSSACRRRRGGRKGSVAWG